MMWNDRHRATAHQFQFAFSKCDGSRRDGRPSPACHTAEDARGVVSAVKFGPAADGELPLEHVRITGVLGQDGGFTAAANDQSLVCVQIEDETAITNVDSILKVEGIDIFFHRDLPIFHSSMGYPGRPNAPAAAAAIAQAQRKIIAAHGMPATAESVREMVGLGVRYIYTHLPKSLDPPNAPTISSTQDTLPSSMNRLGGGAASFLKAVQPAR
jgi:hypothetical protein